MRGHHRRAADDLSQLAREVCGQHRGEPEPPEAGRVGDAGDQRGEGRAGNQVPAVVSDIDSRQRDLPVPGRGPGFPPARAPPAAPGSGSRPAPWARCRNAQRCWQPSWIFTEARERPDTRANGATGTTRAPPMSLTCTSGRRRLTKRGQELREPVLLLVAEDEIHAGEPCHRVRIRLGVSSPSRPARLRGSRG